MPKTIYLAGPISGHYKKGAMSWRNRVTSIVENCEDPAKELEEDYLLDIFAFFDYVVRDPLRGKALETFRGKIKDAYDGEGPLRTEQAIFYRDFNDVYTCDLVLANFEETAVQMNYTASGVAKDVQLTSIGTVMELGWAWAFRKPVVLVLPRKNVHQHTFVRRTATVQVETLEEALPLIPEILG